MTKYEQVRQFLIGEKIKKLKAEQKVMEVRLFVEEANGNRPNMSSDIITIMTRRTGDLRAEVRERLLTKAPERCIMIKIVLLLSNTR